MIAASARTASAKVAAGVSVAVIAGTSSVLFSKPIYNDEASSSGASKLSIYPLPDPKIQVVPVQTELERQIGTARRAVSHLTTDTRASVRALVERWIHVERSIESEVSSLIPASEPLTPGLLYVGVATLAGSIFTRYRALPLRVLTPPLALVASLHYFNPQLAANLGAYYEGLEGKYVPAFGEMRRGWQNEGSKWVDGASKSVGELKERTEQGVRTGLKTVEQQTGLKVADVVAAKDQAKLAIQDQMKAV
ncbi:uncharacterized protein SRS1_15891 [Sporisorium reilianum f. sp. reilianum]|uniref:MICOS complex subunit n=1 Tax=Sporisorium reilianum f. sp. reilianum TaxID=72559 RepID=A0A2N8UJF8_9BASI|nr:uncharacterized protein SRS1_15891 [Sporisorium reilianum f. sp. reilianum]